MYINKTDIIIDVIAASESGAISTTCVCWGRGGSKKLRYLTSNFTVVQPIPFDIVQACKYTKHKVLGHVIITCINDLTNS